MSLSVDEDEILNIAVTEHSTRSRRTKENAAKKGNGKKRSNGNGKKVNFVERSKKSSEKSSHFPSEAPVLLAPIVEGSKKQQSRDKGKKSSEKSSHFPGEAPVVSVPTVKGSKKQQSKDKGKKSSGKSSHVPSEAPMLSAQTFMPAQTVNLFEDPSHDDDELSEKDGLISTSETDSGSDAETSEESENLYDIVTCGDTPEELVEYQMSYMYDLQVGSQLEAQEIIRSIEGEILDSMKESFIACGESSGRRLSSVVGISALPRDQLSGTCGNNCISVDGGVTFYLNEASEVSKNRCDLKSDMVEIMNGIESNNDATTSMAFIETEVLDCEVSPIDSTREERVDQGTKMSNAEKGLPSAAIGVIAIASVLTVALAVFLTRRTRRRSGSTSFNMDNKNNDDASSVLTPVTRGSPTRSSPTRSIQEANSVSSVDSSGSNSDSNPPPISRCSAKSIDEEIQTCLTDENTAISDNGDNAVVITSTSAVVSALEARDLDEDSSIDPKTANSARQGETDGIPVESCNEESKDDTENNSIEKCLEDLVKEEDSSYVTPFVTEVDDDSVDTTATSNISKQKHGK